MNSTTAFRLLRSRLMVLGLTSGLLFNACSGTTAPSPTTAPPAPTLAAPAATPAVPTSAGPTAAPTAEAATPKAPTTAPATAEAPTPAASTSTPVVGGTLTMARNADATNLDPFLTEDDPSIFVDLQIYDRLLRLSQDGKTIEPELATKYAFSADGKSATFTLRQGVKASDGTPLTADDVVFSLKRAVDPKAAWGFLFGPVTGVTKVDEQTVRLDLATPYAPLLAALTTFAASIYPKANFDKWGDAMGQHPLGTGAFMLKSWDPGNELVLTRNPNYWEPGKPYLDEIDFKVVEDDNARVLQLQANAVDLIDNVTPAEVAGLSGGATKVVQVAGGQLQFIRFQNAIPQFADPNVRCAISWAADRETMASTVYFGIGTPALSIMPSSTLYYDPTADPVGFDLAKAKDYLSKSSTPNGFSDTLIIKGGDPAYLSVAQIWVADLEKIGILLTIQPVEQSAISSLASKGDYHMAGLYFTNDTPDPDEITGILDYAVANAFHTGFHDDQLHAMLDQARQELDTTKRAADYSAIQKRANDMCVTVSTIQEPRLYAGSTAVQGFDPNPQGRYFFEDAWKTR